MAAVQNQIFGKMYEVKEHQDSYNSLRRKYLDLSKKAKWELAEYYTENVKSISVFRWEIRKHLNRILQKYVHIAVLDLIDSGIYDIDEIRLDGIAYGENGSQLRGRYGAICARMLEIDQEQTALDAQRKENIKQAGDKVNLGAFVGEGSNFLESAIVSTGAIAGEAALNAASAGATALVTAGVRHFEKKAAEQEKENIFRSISTKQSLLEGIEADVFYLHFVIAQIINQRIAFTYEYPSDEKLQEIEPICRNIMNGNFKDGLDEKVITDYLQINPYELRIYVYLCRKQGGFSEEVRKLMSYYEADVEQLADLFIREKFDLSSCQVYEDAKAMKEQVKESLKVYQTEECKFLYEVLELEEELLIKRRTFREYLYESVEERDAAEKQYNEFSEELKDIEDMDLDELFVKYEKTWQDGIYPKNRAEFQELLMIHMKNYAKQFSEEALLEPYIAKAEELKMNYNLVECEALDMLLKCKKKLQTKKKIAGAVGQIGDKTKELAEKVPISNEGVKTAIAGLGNTKSKLMGAADKVKGAVPALETKDCPSCGNKVKVNGKFCGKCGYKF